MTPMPDNVCQCSIKAAMCDLVCLFPPQEAHPDYADIVKATAAFRSLVVSLGHPGGSAGLNYP